MFETMRQVLNKMETRAPRSVDAARNLRRQARVWWRHRHTDSYILSYPGCGRTWLSLLVGKALVEAHQLDANPLVLKEIHKGTHGLIPRLQVRHDSKPQLRTPEGVERNKDRFAEKAVVFLVRDPRDAIISYYFEASKRRGRFDGSPSEFLRHPVGGLDTVIAYYNTWAKQRSTPKRFYLARYEKLHEDTVGELGRVMECLGCPVDGQFREAATQHARFENMRKIENKGFDREDIERKKHGDKESYKTRKGKVGGYRAYLNDDDVDYLNQRLRDRLSDFYDFYR